MRAMLIDMRTRQPLKLEAGLDRRDNGECLAAASQLNADYLVVVAGYDNGEVAVLTSDTLYAASAHMLLARAQRAVEDQ